MSRIRGKHTEPERALRSLLWRAGLRYRLHSRTPAGRPDLVFPGPRVAVFVDGCFWHGCPDHYVRPRSSSRFWRDKLATNVRRDMQQTRTLEEAGWRVCRIWEHEVFENPANAVHKIQAALNSRRWGPADSWRVVRVVEIDKSRETERRYMCELRNPKRRRTATQRRHTRKWTRRE